MNWMAIDLDHEAYGGASDVFARSASPFSADDLGKRSSAANQARQNHFHAQLRRIATALGSDRIPVFIAFRGERMRMDKGCVGHAVAAGVLHQPENNAAGFVEFVHVRDTAR